MVTIAHIDASARASRYSLAVEFVEEQRAVALRQEMQAVLLDGQQRLHLKKKQFGRRRQLLSGMTDLDFDSLCVTIRSEAGLSEFAARAACLRTVVHQIQRLGVRKMIIESRQDDRDDRYTTHQVRSKQPRLDFDHV